MGTVNNNGVAWYDRKPFRKISDNVLFHGLKVLSCLDRRKRGIEHLEIEAVNKILFIATAGIGDTLFATPVIRGLREKFPHAKIWLLLNEAYFDFFKTNPYVDHAFCVPSNGYRGFLSSIKVIRREKFDVAIVSHAHDYSGTTRPYLAGVRFIIGGMWYRTKFWYLLSNREAHRNYNRNLYSLLEFQSHLAGFLGCYPEDTRMEVYLSKGDKARGEDILAESGLSCGDICVGFQVRTQSPVKDWPAERFIELGKSLLKNIPQVKILLLGAAKDKETAAYVEKGIGDRSVINLAGKTTLGESAAIVNKLNLLITGVTGMLHVATALGTRVVALLGGLEEESKWGTVNHSNESQIKVIKKPRLCEPCNMRVCLPPAKCMKLISADEVLSVVEQCFIS